MKNIVENKYIINIDDLKRIASANIKLKKYVAKYNYYTSIYKMQNNVLNSLLTKWDEGKINRQISHKIASSENKILSTNSKLSKYYNKLLSFYFGNNPNIKKISHNDFNHFIIAYENKLFDDNCLKANQIWAIKKNNCKIWKLKYQLYFCQKLQSKNNKKVDTYTKKIESKLLNCENRKKSLLEIYKSMRYAKLIKLFANNKRGLEQKKNEKSNYVIDIKDLNKYYFNKWIATKILKNVNLQIKHGEFVVILGPSGSGKTTLLNVMSAMDCATCGSIIVNNKNLINLNESERTNFRKNNIGYIFQQYGLLPNLSVKENIEIGANLQTKEKQLNINDLLKTIGLEPYADYFPHELSGGQQQRVSIARSVAKNPSIIFADEPTGAIDDEMSKQILQLFIDINKKYNTTIVIVTHNSIFAELANRVIKVRSGCIVSDEINKKQKKVNELNWTKN